MCLTYLPTNSQTYKCVPCQVRVVGYFTENTSVIGVDSTPLYTNTWSGGFLLEPETEVVQERRYLKIN